MNTLNVSGNGVLAPLDDDELGAERCLPPGRSRPPGGPLLGPAFALPFRAVMETCSSASESSMTIGCIGATSKSLAATYTKVGMVSIESFNGGEIPTLIGLGLGGRTGRKLLLGLIFPPRLLLFMGI